MVLVITMAASAITVDVSPDRFAVEIDAPDAVSFKGDPDLRTALLIFRTDNAAEDPMTMPPPLECGSRPLSTVISGRKD